MRSNALLGITLLCLVLGLGFTHNAFAKEAAEAYRTHSEETFYFFSEASFESFTCRMQVDALDNLVQSIEAQFKAAKMPVSVKENRADFQVSFVRAQDTPTFIEPSLTLEMQPGAPLKDPETTKAGIAQVEAGYKGVVIGAVQVVRGVFDEFISSRFAKYKDVVFKADAKGYDASFTKDEGQIQESFDGRIRRMTFSAQGQSITSKSTYAPKGKAGLLLASAELIPGPGMRITITVDYQRIKGLLLPKTISVASRQELGGKVVENLVGVTLQGCKVKR